MKRLQGRAAVVKRVREAADESALTVPIAVAARVGIAGDGEPHKFPLPPLEYLSFSVPSGPSLAAKEDRGSPPSPLGLRSGKGFQMLVCTLYILEQPLRSRTLPIVEIHSQLSPPRDGKLWSCRVHFLQKFREFGRRRHIVKLLAYALGKFFTAALRERVCFEVCIDTIEPKFLKKLAVKLLPPWGLRLVLLENRFLEILL